jgi:uncharacterized membrane protein YfcA
MGGIEFFLVGLAAVAGGAVNALAGGGTLITFPMLMAVGLPAITANVTNTVALCPGYFGATLAQLNDLQGQGKRLWMFLPVSMLGGIAGGILLLNTGEHAFHKLIPFLILLAVCLLAVQDKLRAWILQRIDQNRSASAKEGWSILAVAPAAVYGGYFGAGVSVIVLAMLGLVLNDSLTRLNALKQSISLSINIAAAIFLLFSGKVVWLVALVMSVGALAGGMIGGRLAGRIRPVALRRIVVVFGVGIAVFYFIH